MKLDIRLLTLGLAIVLGISFELMKFNPETPLKRTAKLTITQDIQPYSVSTHQLAQEKTRPLQPIQNIRMQNPNQPAVALPEATIETSAQNKQDAKAEGKDAKAEEEKKVTEADEFEDVMDPKTGQIVRRKKAKTEEEKLKQEEEEKMAKLKQEQEANDKLAKEKAELEKQKLADKNKESDHPQNNNIIGGAASIIQQQQAALQAAAAAIAGSGMSASEWEKKLLAHPDLVATTAFVQAYRSGQLSSTSFYRIVDVMLKDSRQDMRSLGLMALGSTPSLASFNQLAQLLKTEPTTSELQTKINEYLNQYTDLQHLDVLSSVMNASSSAFNVVLALDKVDASAQKYLSNRADPNYARNVNYFKPLIALLETLSKSSDASIMASAQKTLADVKSLTSTT